MKIARPAPMKVGDRQRFDDDHKLSRRTLSAKLRRLWRRHSAPIDACSRRQPRGPGEFLRPVRSARPLL